MSMSSWIAPTRTWISTASRAPPAMRASRRSMSSARFQLPLRLVEPAERGDGLARLRIELQRVVEDRLSPVDAGHLLPPHLADVDLQRDLLAPIRHEREVVLYDADEPIPETSSR